LHFSSAKQGDSIKTKLQKIIAGLFSIFLVGVLTLSPLQSLQAQESQPSHVLEYKKSGFFLGGELAALVGFDDSAVIGAPGKLDLLAGYQINPYVSVAVDLWTFWFIAYAAEAHLKANFTDTKISPYVVGTAGIVGVLNVFDDEEEDTGAAFVTYSAGLGIDFHLWKQGTLFAEAKYRGVRLSTFEDISGVVGGLEMGVGFRWTF
jgi:hypothetical protein